MGEYRNAAGGGKHGAVVVAVAGLIAGSLDISSAIVLTLSKGGTPLRLFQYIASGLLGAKAFEGGLATAALGGFLHFVIAFAAATVFYLVARKLPALIQHPIAAGLSYGLIIHAVMNLLVLPLSAAKAKYTVSGVIIQLIIHMLLLGLPISLIVRRLSTPRPLA